jgi:lipid II:glycine glycyltransferase (peptidoglycan interpeptide bridge formation enzyme)
MELQQSHLYAKYIRALGWQVFEIDGQYIYLKKLLFLGAICKIQRPTKLPSISKILDLCRTHHVTRLAIEPDRSISQATLSAWLTQIPSNIRINTDYFLPTKTVVIDVSPPTDRIFASFSEAKRRAVRRAQKLGVTVTESTDIRAFIRLKNKAAGFLGTITTFGLDILWSIFAPKYATILLASNAQGKTVGGICMIIWKSTAYYWVAGATDEGKKLFAPTLLVWHAVLAAKKYKARVLDFVGVWDERIPKQNRAWLGFTKFKEGFSGITYYYPLSASRL